MFKDGLHLIEFAELVEIEVNSVQYVYKFPQNNENIERGNCESIIIFSPNETIVSPKNRPIVNNNVLNSSFLNLYNKNLNNFFNVPLNFLRYNTFEYNNYHFFNNFSVNLSMSSIYVTNVGQLSLNVGESFVFLFIFSEKEKCSC